MPKEPSIPLPPPGELGPAMRALNDNQRAFVISLVEHGDDNHTRAAIEAGYSENPASARVTGYRLFHDERVQAAMLEEARKRMQGGAIMAVSTILGVMKNSMDKKDQLKAAEMVLNRTGMHATSEHKIAVEHSRKDGDDIKAILNMAKALGIDPVALLGKAGVKGEVIEGEFKLIEPPKEMTGLEGLEDLMPVDDA